MSDMQKQELSPEDRITLMARDPNWLYVYWNISDDRRERFAREFGQEFSDRSFPFLKVTNITKNSSFYIRINDFSDNWYINIQDPDCLYRVEIGRKASEEFFVALSGSNSVTAPSSSISANTTVYYADYKDLRNGNFIMKLPDQYPYGQDTLAKPSPGSQELFSGPMSQAPMFGEFSSCKRFADIPSHPGLISG